MTSCNIVQKNILGVKVDFNLTKSDFLSIVKEMVEKRVGSYICTVNPEFIMEAQKDIGFRTILNESYLNVPDGSGVLMAEKYLSHLDVIKGDKPTKVNLVYKLALGISTGLKAVTNPNFLGEQITGSDTIYDICELASKNGFSVMFLGGWGKDKWGRPLPQSGNIAQKAADILKSKFPQLKVVLATSDINHKEENDASNLATIKEALNKIGLSHIDVLFVAFGHRKQESWLRRNMSKIPASCGIGIGGSLDFIEGSIKRAPSFMTKYHLEWLYRLAQNPWRVKRILIAFPGFPLKIFFNN